MQFISRVLILWIFCTVQEVLLRPNDRFVRDISGTYMCLDTEFQCRITKKCVSRDLVRNGRFNCGGNDTSDEDYPLPRCHADEFRCRVNGQCLPRTRINMLIGQCKDQSDAGGIRGLPCRKDTEFRCPQGRCIPRRYVRSRTVECTRSLLDEDTGLEWSCNEDEFRCPRNGRCIPRDKVRDRFRDCPSGTDEKSSSILSECGVDTGEYRCPGPRQRCIPRSSVGDGIPDCGGRNSTDELVGVLRSCSATEFACLAMDSSNHRVVVRCIPRSWVNDGLRHCPGGEDEEVQRFICRQSEHSCDEGKRCLPPDKMCDGAVDCQDCSDEVNPKVCERETTTKYFVCNHGVGLEDEFDRNGVLSSHCILRSYFCDGKVDCADGSDEQVAGVGMKCRKTHSGSKGSSTCILPASLVNDGVVDCDEGLDEGSFVKTTDKRAACLGVSQEIFQKQVCDEVFDCPNLTDECLCAKRSSRNRAVEDICENICYGSTFDAVQKAACDFCGVGRLLCPKEEDTHSGSARTRKCVDVAQICDGKRDCPNGVDEWYCKTLEAEIEERQSEGAFSTMTCPHEYLTNRYSTELSSTAKVCNGVPECLGLVDECNVDVDQGPKCGSRIPSYCALAGEKWCSGSLPLIPSQLCDGIPHCDGALDEMLCNDTRFMCDVISTSSLFRTANASFDIETLISIPKHKVCDGFADCRGGADELDCPEHFYCRNGEAPIYVARNRIQDGVRDCTDGSDECPDENAFQNDPLSSRSELLANKFVLFWLYVVAVTAVTCNFVVLVSKSSKMLRIRLLEKESTGCRRLAVAALDVLMSKSPRRQGALAKCNDVLVFNLALADTITGFYLVALIVKANQYSGDYCSQDTTWRSSMTCQNIGIMMLSSAQTSIFLLVSLTSYRLYAVLNPVKATNLQASRACLWASCCWAISLAIACIPILPGIRDSFVSSVWFSQKEGTSRFLHLSHDGIKRSALADLLGKLCALIEDGRENGTLQVCRHIEQTSWNCLTKAVKEFFPAETIQREFGYYGAHGVCLPSLFSSYAHLETGATHMVRRYSVLIVVINFTACIYIALAYAAIVMRTKTRNSRLRSRNDPQNGRQDTASCLHGVTSNRDQIKGSVRSKKNVQLDSRTSSMNKKIARLVLVNCSCWVPICLIGFTAQFGAGLPGWVYSLVAVVLLPINCAADPFIYSEVIHNGIKSLWRKAKRKISKTSMRTAVEIPLELTHEDQSFERGNDGNNLHSDINSAKSDITESKIPHKRTSDWRCGADISATIPEE